MPRYENGGPEGPPFRTFLNFDKLEVAINKFERPAARFFPRPPSSDTPCRCSSLDDHQHAVLDLGVVARPAHAGGHPIDSGAGCASPAMEGAPELVVIDLMQQCREPGLARSSRRRVYSFETGRQRCPALCPVSRHLVRVLLGSRPSLRLARHLRPHQRYYTSIRHPVLSGSEQLRLSLADRLLRQPRGAPDRTSWVPTRSLPA